MSLTLKVLSFKGQILNEQPVLIGDDGGSIGRSDDNTLVLADTDRIVSRHHAEIKSQNGFYYLTDTSLAGVYINNKEPALHNDTIQLQHGMLLKIGEYEISVSIANPKLIDDFAFIVTSPPTHSTNDFLSINEPWVETEELINNPLMSDSFATHEELIEKEIPTPIFNSQLNPQQSPLFDSYIAPNLVAEPSSSTTAVPENFSFDDLFAETEPTPAPTTTQTADSFEDFFGNLVEDAIAQTEPVVAADTPVAELMIESVNVDEANPLFANSTIEVEPIELQPKEPIPEIEVSNGLETLSIEEQTDAVESVEPPALFEQTPSPIETTPVVESSSTVFAEPSAVDKVTALFTEVKQEIVESPSLLFTEPESETSVLADDELAALFTEEAAEITPIIKPSSALFAEPTESTAPTKSFEHPSESSLFAAPQSKPKTTTTPTEKAVASIDAQTLFNAFLQGVGIETDMPPEQQAETLHNIGQMFRELIDGTVAVLRSRAEFKSMCRVSMTVIRATDNNPLKFTVSTDDVLKQLVENNQTGFLNSTVAIEEAFDDIMNHQLAMQAGIQASLTNLLETFNPHRIEKQFEQGIVLQKKAKCWESYEKTYNDTVENAVENFFGDEFVRAYEQQMNVLKKSRKQ